MRADLFKKNTHKPWKRVCKSKNKTPTKEKQKDTAKPTSEEKVEAHAERPETVSVNSDDEL